MDCPRGFCPDHIHFSQLRSMAKSPAHYKALETRPREDSLAMRIGRTIHAMVLGGDFIVYEGTRRGTEWTAFESANVGREIITGSEAAASREVADAVLSHPRAAELLAGQHEFCLSWKLARRACAGHLDVLGSNFITDLKTTTNAEPGWFARHALQMGYAAQMAWYLDGVVAAGLPAPENVYVVAVETKYPYVISTFELTPRALEMGRKQYRLWFERVLICEASDYWPGYIEGTAPLDAPDDNTLWIDGEEVAA